MDELTRGHFSRIDYTDGILRVSGWLATPGHSIDSFRVAVGDATVRQVAAEADPALDAMVERLPHTTVRRFNAEVDCSPADWVEVAVYGQEGGEDIGRMFVDFIPGYADGLPLPPSHLRMRVSGSEDALGFHAMALKAFTDFRRKILARFGSMPRRLLDWGCGSGRLAALFARYFDSTEVHGCDIDGEAVAWCSENIARASFGLLPLAPPSKYEDATFDVIVAQSMLSQLDPENQKIWLGELRRLMRPGGVLVAGVNGRLCAQFSSQTYVARRLERRGIAFSPDAVLSGRAPAGYHRSVFQSRTFTEAEWSKRFEIVDYVEAGFENFRDLVVLRAPGASQDSSVTPSLVSQPKRTRSEWIRVMNTAKVGHFTNDRGADYDQAWREVSAWRDEGLWKEGDHIVEVGSGNGRLAVPFTEFDVTYLGVEPMRECVEYCKRVFEPWPNFRFVHADVYNGAYNPHGRLRPEEFRFPLHDDSVDVLIFASVFTHLANLDAARRYIAETFRTLKPGGKAKLSWFRAGPNAVRCEPDRTVYFEKDIINLVAPFEVIQTADGFTDRFADQWIMTVRKPSAA